MPFQLSSCWSPPRWVSAYFGRLYCAWDLDREHLRVYCLSFMCIDCFRNCRSWACLGQKHLRELQVHLTVYNDSIGQQDLQPVLNLHGQSAVYGAHI